MLLHQARISLRTLAFYPGCAFTYREDEDIAAQPVRVFQGTDDNYNPIASCRAYVERLKAKGKDVRLTEFSGTSHTFDVRVFNPPVVLAQAQTYRNCRWEEGDDGQLFNPKTRQPFSYSDPCIERGTTIAYNEKAAMEASKAVAEFVAATLKPPHSP